MLSVLLLVTSPAALSTPFSLCMLLHFFFVSTTLAISLFLWPVSPLLTLQTGEHTSPFGFHLIISKSLPDLTQSIKLSLAGKCSSHPSSKKHPFTANGDHYRKPQLDKMQKSTDHGDPRLIGYIDNIIPVLKAQRTSWKNGAEIL